MMVHMGALGRLSAAGTIVLLAAGALSSCSSSPSARQKSAVTTTTAATTTSTSTTTTTTTTTTQPGVAVPNVIGLKIAAAHGALHAAGLSTLSLNLPCNKGTLASQSVVSTLSIPDSAPSPSVGAVPLNPGATVPPGTRIGITWSGCYGNGSSVPAVVGLTFTVARHALHAVGLTWSCFSVGRPTTTTTTISSSTTAAAVTTTTDKPAMPPETVLTQNPAPGAVLKPGSIVSFTMPVCPQ
jgi:beta-lactam-binding protein with PASTA domain